MELSRQEILEILRMPEEEYRQTIMAKARQVYREADNTLYAAAMMGYSNICRSQCLYCGMRASHQIPRYRMEVNDVIESFRLAKENGLKRAFLISGEDPGYGFDKLVQMVEAIHGMGFYISLATGEFDLNQYQELKAAGADEYVIKFEMGQEETFNRLNPSTNFRQRMAAIENVKKSGLALASGNIIDYPGQTDEMIAEDILLTKELDISWAPVVPYMPAMGTPLAQEGGPGKRIKALKEVSILRLMMPGIRITAQHPGDDLTKGLSDETGNREALLAGGNILFVDLLPAAKQQAFKVLDHRDLKGMDHIRKMASEADMKLE